VQISILCLELHVVRRSVPASPCHGLPWGQCWPLLWRLLVCSEEETKRIEELSSRSAEQVREQAACQPARSISADLPPANTSRHGQSLTSAWAIFRDRLRIDWAETTTS